MVKKCGQVSIEYLMIFGFVAIAVIIVLGVAFNYSGSIKDGMKMTQLKNYADNIVTTSESVFYAGEPSKATIDCYLPESVTSVQVIENSIYITIETFSGTNKVLYPSKVPISGNLSNNGGVKKIEVSANETSITLTETQDG